MNNFTVINDFEAKWSNFIGDEKVCYNKKFIKGEIYEIIGTRPEGIMIEGFFLFEKYLANCKVAE